MKTQPTRRSGGNGAGEGKKPQGKSRVTVRDITPVKDAKGGRTKVKDSHDR